MSDSTRQSSKRGLFEQSTADGSDSTDPAQANLNPVERERFDDFNPNDSALRWHSMFWVAVLLAALGGLVFSQYQLSKRNQEYNQVAATVATMSAQINEIGHQALLASSGNKSGFEKLAEIRNRVDTDLALLKTGEQGAGINPVAESAKKDLLKIEQIWSQIKPELDVLLNNREVIQQTLSEVAMVNELTPQLLARTDEVVEKLIAGGANLELVNIASRQRFLSQRIKASLNEFATGSPGWEVAATQFGRDVKLFGQINDAIARQGGAAIADITQEVKALHNRLSRGANRVISNVGDYFALRTSADTVTRVSDGIGEVTRSLQKTLAESSRSGIGPRLPWILGAIAFLALLALFWTLNRQAQRRSEFNAWRTRRSEEAVIKLLDEMGDLAQGDLTVQVEVTNEVTGAIADSINFAVGEMRKLVSGIRVASNEVSSATDGTKELTTQMLTSNSVQTEEITAAALEVSAMTEAINRMSGSAAKSTDRARNSAKVAKAGAGAVRDTISGMNNTRNQIQDTAKRLKRLGESTQQINEIVNLIQDVTEQTNVLSLNASIQAAMAGEAGRGFAVVAEEVQRLADRSARASSEITELVQNIQSDTNSAIASMESTTEEVVAGATMADRAGQALGEIESVSQDLLEIIDQVAAETIQGAVVAKSVSKRMNKLKVATEQSDSSVSQVGAGLDRMKAVALNLNASISGFKLPKRQDS